MDSNVLEGIKSTGVVAVLRGAFPPQIAAEVCQTLFQEGVQVFEMTTNSEKPFEAMRAVKDVLGDQVKVGMGTVLDVAAAAHAMDTGADFVVSPAFQPVVVETVMARDVLMIPGVITPSEAVAAWQMGVPLLKLFPIGPLGLPYFNAVVGPLDHMEFMCNGGIDAENTREFIHAGALAVGVGGWLTGDGTWPEARLRSRAKVLLNAVAAGRGEPESHEA